MKELLILIKEDVDNVAAFVLQIFTFIGKKTPLHEEFSDILEHLVPICKSFIKNGTSKQAKHAVKCLYINTASTDESVFADVLEIVTQNLSDGVTARGESYKTAIVSLGKFKKSFTILLNVLCIKYSRVLILSWEKLSIRTLEYLVRTQLLLKFVICYQSENFN